jgi:hypothetical protein
MTRARSSLLISGHVVLSQSKNCALELRASEPLDEGAELLIHYTPPLRVRADRQKDLEVYGFHCHCEVCDLHHHLSDSRDAKIELAIEAGTFVDRFLKEKEHDVFLGLVFLEALMSTLTEIRLIDEYLLMKPIFFFALFGRLEPLREVGRVLLPILERYWGTGPGATAAKFLSSYLDDPQKAPTWKEEKQLGCDDLPKGLNEALQIAASNIVSILQSLP